MYRMNPSLIGPAPVSSSNPNCQMKYTCTYLHSRVQGIADQAQKIANWNPLRGTSVRDQRAKKRPDNLHSLCCWQYGLLLDLRVNNNHNAKWLKSCVIILGILVHIGIWVIVCDDCYQPKLSDEIYMYLPPQSSTRNCWPGSKDCKLEPSAPSFFWTVNSLQ
jgi:hypothetical protein